MKTTLMTLATLSQLMTQLYAGGNIEAVDVEVSAEIEEMHEEESKFYVVAKGMYMLGDSAKHKDALLEGDKDFGYGLDIGYRIANGFALELDVSYGKNSVQESVNNETEEAEATYTTSAIDLVYVYEATESLGIFGKVGYEYEWETIDAYDIDGTDHGVVFGAGVEVAIDESYKFIAEYEHSTIEGPHGDSIFAGVMYNF